MDWARVLAYVTGTVDQELLARNEYLTAENRILKAQLKGRLKLSDVERATLGEICHRLGRKPSPKSQLWPGRIRSCLVPQARRQQI
jgi:putative transposase